MELALIIIGGGIAGIALMALVVGIVFATTIKVLDAVCNLFHVWD